MILNNVQSEEGDGGGIVCAYGSQPTITSCTISNNDLDGVYSFGGASPIIHNCNITDNIGYGVNNTTDTVIIDAESNWWGDASGPYHPSTNPSGMGSLVSDYVDFSPWLTNPGVEEYKTTAPLVLKLQVTPNPCRYATTIRYSILARPASQGEAGDSRFSIRNPTIAIYDAGGRLVRSFDLESSIENQGSAISWYGDDNSSRKLPSGVYFVKLSAGDYAESEKILLIK
jgi:parallel beta-helix repeat protein